MNDPLVRIRRVGSPRVPLPDYQTARAAGMDLCARLDSPLRLETGERRLIPCGIAVSLPTSFEGQVRPRSGLALKHGISIVNAPGTIDADYRGEISVLLINLGKVHYIIEPLSRIAQLVIAPVVRARLEEVSELDDTARGSSGYGSTGV